MVCVPGGPFMMGCRSGHPPLPDETCDNVDEMPYHQVNLAAFEIDVTAPASTPAHASVPPVDRRATGSKSAGTTIR
jgi:hypothetical protein